ncbi:MAG: hypothetical protein L0Z50_10665 [Verrucomicrobiales bacterium]|nr:hypothetical protein [Verrucomicrobiales bacterium]
MNAAQKMTPTETTPPAWKPKVFPKPEIKRLHAINQKPSVARTHVRPSAEAMGNA